MSGVASAAGGRISINIPNGIFSDLMENTEQSELNLSFVAYSTSNLFPVAQSGSRHHKFQISSMVISASIAGQNITRTSQNMSVSTEIDPVSVVHNSIIVRFHLPLVYSLILRLTNFPNVFSGALWMVSNN